MLYYNRQSINEHDISSVVDVLKSEYLTTGPCVPNFESALSDYCGAEYCAAVANATCALHLAMLALDIGAGDVIWTTPISFASTANAALFVGAEVRFVDIDPFSFNVDPNIIAQKINTTSAKELPKAIIAVHLGGNPADMQALYDLCKSNNILLVEDASHALGAKIEGSRIGSCAFSDVTVFSFHPVKMITTGEGGALLTNSKKIYERLTLLRTHGITRDHGNLEFKNKPWYYEQIDLGFNYRMSDIHAALGLSQLTRLDDFVSKRNFLASLYQDLLEDTSVSFQWVAEDNISSFHLCIVLFQSTQQRDLIYNELLALGIQCNLHYIPIYRFPFYIARYGTQFEAFPNSETYFNTALSVPLFVDLEPSKVEEIALKIKSLI